MIFGNYLFIRNYCKDTLKNKCYNKFKLLEVIPISQMRFLQKSLDYIENNLDKEFNVNELAQICGYSTYHFIKLFAKYTGLTPFKYVRRRRLKEVVVMKAAGMTFYDAAAKFNTSSSALARAFKEEYNCTISDFHNNEVNIELQDKIKLKTIDANWNNAITNIIWQDKQDNNHYCHSFPAALYTVLSQTNQKLELFEILGFSGFAFRIDMHKELCPSATSVFDWNSELGFAVKNCACDYQRIERLWDKYIQRDEIREKAVTAIKKSLADNKLPICWDLIIPEWSIIVGYCKETDSFLAIGPNNMKSALKTCDLGQREIEILDLTIINKHNDFSDDLFRNALEYAVKHGESQFWTDRPAYEQGLKAWDMWINAINNFSNIDSDKKYFACTYHANNVGSARLGASKFLNKYCKGNELLKKAATNYEAIANICFKIAESVNKNITLDQLINITEDLAKAKSLEKDCIKYLKQWLNN